MATRELIITDRHGDDVEKVTYDIDTLLIESISVWTESAQDFRDISVWQYKASAEADFARLELKVVKHNFEALTGESERRDEDKFQNFRETGGR